MPPMLRQVQVTVAEEGGPATHSRWGSFTWDAWLSACMAGLHGVDVVWRRPPAGEWW